MFSWFCWIRKLCLHQNATAETSAQYYSTSAKPNKNDISKATRARSQKVTKAKQAAKATQAGENTHTHTHTHTHTKATKQDPHARQKTENSSLKNQWLSFMICCINLLCHVADAMILCVEHDPAKLQMMGGFGKRPPWTWLIHYIHWNPMYHWLVVSLLFYITEFMLYNCFTFTSFCRFIKVTTASIDPTACYTILSLRIWHSALVALVLHALPYDFLFRNLTKLPFVYRLLLFLRLFLCIHLHHDFQ